MVCGRSEGLDSKGVLLKNELRYPAFCITFHYGPKILLPLAISKVIGDIGLRKQVSAG